ncbi:Hypothetical predicted protein [Pelobates cultripes]|uniref:Uncharacterized protein n=1 Tax=Pelobates cultripes TaxID=61616 RepID=A0AAD1RQB6_PELCU|nr:Hypothetical predicted protein [Pelobates cultripes]
MGNHKKAQPNTQLTGKIPADKTGSVTRLFKEYADCVSDSGDPNMALTAANTDSYPPSPTASDTSHTSTDMDIREILRSLPSKTDLAQMLSRLETTFQHKMDGLSSEIKQIGAGSGG